MGIRLEHVCTLFDPQTTSLIARLDVDIYKKIIKTIFEYVYSQAFHHWAGPRDGATNLNFQC